jgi:hypothetical protein
VTGGHSTTEPLILIKFVKKRGKVITILNI